MFLGILEKMFPSYVLLDFCSWSFIVEFVVLCKVEETLVICISSHSAESTFPIVDLFVSSSYL